MAGARRTGVLLVAGLVTLLVAGVAVPHRLAYGVWWGSPTRITYCGRQYAEGRAGLSRTEVDAQVALMGRPGEPAYALVRERRIPLTDGDRLWVGAPDGHLPTERPCVVGVYVEHTDGTFTEFGLQGGP